MLEIKERLSIRRLAGHVSPHTKGVWTNYKFVFHTASISWHGAYCTLGLG